jgi:hypothetical protein
MDPVSMIVMALVTGAAAALKPTAEAVIKDAYAGIKRLIQDKYKAVSVDLIESDPASKSRQAVVQEDLEKAGAGQDVEVLQLATALLDAVQSKAPEAAGAVGVDLEAIKAASASIKKIVAEGPGAVGVRAKQVEVTGEFVVEDVQARSGADDPKP